MIAGRGERVAVGVDLDRAAVTRRPIDHGCLCATKRLNATLFGTQADRRYPFVSEAGVLSRAHVMGVLDPARECVVGDLFPHLSSQAGQLALTSLVISNWTGRSAFC